MLFCIYKEDSIMYNMYNNMTFYINFCSNFWEVQKYDIWSDALLHENSIKCN